MKLEQYFEQRRPIRPLRIWALWVLASTLGGTLGLLLSFPLLQPLSFLGAALGMALGQWLILRGFVRNAHGWIFMSMVGGFLASLVTLVLLDALGRTIGMNIGSVLLAAGILGLLGAAQWALLRHVFERAGWWVVANLLAGVVGMGLLGLLIRNTGVFEGGSLMTGLVLLWIIYGLITGGVLVWLLKQRRKQPAPLP